jgi:fluoride ion exporter CrcB/FEX
MKNALVVGLGGFFGCIARYLTSVLIVRFFDTPVFPYATLIVNISGCFLIAYLVDCLKITVDFARYSVISHDGLIGRVYHLFSFRVSNFSTRTRRKIVIRHVKCFGTHHLGLKRSVVGRVDSKPDLKNGAIRDVQ